MKLIDICYGMGDILIGVLMAIVIFPVVLWRHWREHGKKKKIEKEWDPWI